MKEWLRSGRAKLGTVVTIPDPTIADLVRLAGFDWVWVDAEHGRFDEATAATFCSICSGGPKTLVRIPDQSPTTIKRFLDIGCDGIIVPQVNSVEDTDRVVKAALYPPKGERSVGIARAQGYGTSFIDYVAKRQYGIIVQIESAAGVSAIDDIIKNPDIDGVLIGPYDLSGSMGVIGQVNAPEVQEGIAKVLESCISGNIPCGIYSGAPENARKFIAQGFNFVGIGIDASLLVNAMISTRQTTEQS